MQTSMKRGTLSDPFQYKQNMAFFLVIFLFQMTYLGYFMGEIKYGNFKIGCITCKGTSKRPEKSVTNDFHINFRYAFIHAKTTLSIEYQ